MVKCQICDFEFEGVVCPRCGAKLGYERGIGKMR